MNLAQYLEYHDITQKKFAKKIGISPLTLHKILSGKNIPRLDTALKIENETYGKVTCDSQLKSYYEYKERRKLEKDKKKRGGK